MIRSALALVLGAAILLSGNTTTIVAPRASALTSATRYYRDFHTLDRSSAFVYGSELQRRKVKAYYAFTQLRCVYPKLDDPQQRIFLRRTLPVNVRLSEWARNFPYILALAYHDSSFMNAYVVDRVAIERQEAARYREQGLKTCAS